MSLILDGVGQAGLPVSHKLEHEDLQGERGKGFALIQLGEVTQLEWAA